MQEPLPPVLVFAQSGRFFAQSASQAGYPVWVADCFGDQDTLAVAERWHQLAPIQQLSNEQILNTFSVLSQGEACLLICGAGIESHYPILNKLPDNIKLIGNGADIIHTVQTPELFFTLLEKLSLNYPETRFERPNHSGWLTKSSSGFGGIHIQPLQTHQYNKNIYFQRYIKGSSGSVLFVANGQQAQLLSINRHYLQPSTATPFRLGGIISPWEISDQHQCYLEQAINKITPETYLQGINSLDFIISEEGQLFLLEINPRMSASAELLNDDKALFQLYINAFHGLLPEKMTKKHPSFSGLHYIYANQDIYIPDQMIWPSACHDIPVSGTFILSGDPICTLHDKATSATDLHQRFDEFDFDIKSALYP
jgi:predicted ATP-grasp superfamily ATP-dependent carboligase